MEKVFQLTGERKKSWTENRLLLLGLERKEGWTDSRHGGVSAASFRGLRLCSGQPHSHQEP